MISRPSCVSVPILINPCWMKNMLLLSSPMSYSTSPGLNCTELRPGSSVLQNFPRNTVISADDTFASSSAVTSGASFRGTPIPKDIIASVFLEQAFLNLHFALGRYLDVTPQSDRDTSWPLLGIIFVTSWSNLQCYSRNTDYLRGY